jgi:hypothetical protein
MHFRIKPEILRKIREKKIGKLEALSDLAELELEEGETDAIDGIKKVRIIVEDEVEVEKTTP